MDAIIPALGYPVAGGYQEFLSFIDSWIDIVVASKFRDEIFNHWILGRGAEEKKPRWSIIRNILK